MASLEEQSVPKTTEMDLLLTAFMILTPLKNTVPSKEAYQMTFLTIFCIKEVLMQIMDLKLIISPIKLTTASQNILDMS